MMASQKKASQTAASFVAFKSKKIATGDMGSADHQPHNADFVFLSVKEKLSSLANTLERAANKHTS